MPRVESARDNPGTLREYECVLILRPDTLQEGILEINNKIRDLARANDGRLLSVENWGKRRLAYEIKKQLKGIYLYYQLLGHGPLILEMERNLRLSESVVRYFTLRVDESVDPDVRPAELTDEDFLAASATRPDEEELATGYVMTGKGERIPVSDLGYEERNAAKAASGDQAPKEAPKETALQAETAEAKADDTPAKNGGTGEEA